MPPLGRAGCHDTVRNHCVLLHPWVLLKNLYRISFTNFQASLTSVKKKIINNLTLAARFYQSNGDKNVSSINKVFFFSAKTG